MIRSKNDKYRNIDTYALLLSKNMTSIPSEIIITRWFFLILFRIWHDPKLSYHFCLDQNQNFWVQKWKIAELFFGLFFRLLFWRNFVRIGKTIRRITWLFFTSALGSSLRNIILLFCKFSRKYGSILVRPIALTK